jgi:hypothetical protein
MLNTKITNLINISQIVNYHILLNTMDWKLDILKA